MEIVSSLYQKKLDTLLHTLAMAVFMLQLTYRSWHRFRCSCSSYLMQECSLHSTQHFYALSSFTGSGAPVRAEITALCTGPL